MRFIAVNPKTKMSITMTAKDKDEFILELVKKAPHIAGWYPDEVRACVEEDMIKEVSMNKTQEELIEYIKNVINRAGGALPSEGRIEKYARDITAIIVKE